MILGDFYAMSNDLLEASMETRNDVSNDFIPRTGSPESKPGAVLFRPEAADFKSFRSISLSGQAEFVFDPQVDDFHPHIKVSNELSILYQI